MKAQPGVHMVEEHAQQLILPKGTSPSIDLRSLLQRLQDRLCPGFAQDVWHGDYTSLGYAGRRRAYNLSRPA